MKDAEWPGGRLLFFPSSVSQPLSISSQGHGGRLGRARACLHASLSAFRHPHAPHPAPAGTTTDPFSQLPSAALTAVSQLSGLLWDGQKHRSTSATLACPGVNSMLKSLKCHRSFKLNRVCAPSKRKVHGDSCLC